MWKRKRSDRDRRAEMRAHIRIEADQLEAEGLAPEEALATARARFGHTAHVAGPRPWLGLSRIEIVAHQIRHAARQLRRSPVTTATILGSLIIGIGANTAIFSLAHQVLLRALPIDAPEELVQLHWDGEFIGGGRGVGSLLPHPLYQDLLESQEVFRQVAARSPGEVTVIAASGGSERLRVELVTGGYFRMLGVQPHLGRIFTEDDDRILDGHPVVIVSHEYWRTRLGADPDIIGRDLRVNGRSMTIVGIAQPGFHGTDWSVVPDLWLPMMMNDLAHEWGDLDERRVRFQHVYARLATGIDTAQAEAALRPWFARYIRADMEREGWPGAVDAAALQAYLESRLAVRPGGQGQAARANALRQPILILAAATVLVLLLACLNVANLSLAKAVARQRDTGIRVALGASRRRVVAERLVESALLALVGGGAGLLLAPVVGAWILDYLTVDGAAMAVSAQLDGRSIVTAAVIAVAATLVSGVGPAWFAGAAHPVGAIRSGTRSVTGGLGVRRLLVVGQVSLALVLLVGAGLFGATLRSLELEGPGFATDRLVTFTVAPSNDGYDELTSKRTLRRILEQVRALSDVDKAGVGVWPLLEGGGWGNTVLIEGVERTTTEDALPMNAVSPGFFDALGVTVTRGRDFDEHDVYDEPGWLLRSAIVSESFVQRFLPDENPIGVRIDFGGDDSRAARMEIVGVVAGYREQAIRDPRPQVFFPIWERSANSGTFYVRTRGAIESTAAQLLGVVERIDPQLAVRDFRSLDDQIDRLLTFERMLATLGRAFAAFATLLAIIGIYGVLSFTAHSRTKEIGIRVALGARRRAAGGLILGEALRLAALGIAIATPAIWVLGRLIESQLYGVAAADPFVVALATLLLLLVSFAASAVPAWRASRIDPLAALNVE